NYELEQLIEWRGKPEKIRVDNRPEFIAEKQKPLFQKKDIVLYYIQPGKPTKNSLIERYNRTFRTDFLNAYLFENIKEMKNYTEIWMWMYNNERPHSSLQYLSPRNFLLKYGKVKNPNDFPTFQINQNNNTIILNKNSTFKCS
ncbi:integrase core domain-containing protein, partial [Empedobacter sp. UBA5039]|uniref:integrase core domain-containing protein n=1 Tax=Empedobacter sp. UBA5039 TaxID=1946439 RepID=UPI0025B86003